MTTNGYNGYANYQTWAVALWIDNDEGLYNDRRSLVARVSEDAGEIYQVSEGIWTVEQARRYEIADTLKRWVRDEMMPDLGASLYADLLGSALDLVDWHELAQHWLDEHVEESAEA